MSAYYISKNANLSLNPTLITIIERRLLPLCNGPWVVGEARISARAVPNHRDRPATTEAVEFAVEHHDGWAAWVRAVLCDGKLWRPEEWLRIHRCFDDHDRSRDEVIVSMTEWLASV